MNFFKEQGFTLLELIVVLVIIAISVALAAPNFSNVIRKNNIVAATNELTGLLQYAKSMAIATNAPAIVCPLESGDNIDNLKCIDSYDKFKTSTKIGVFTYTSKSTMELSRSMNLPKTVTLKDINNKALKISFYPDNSAGIHGISVLFYFNKDGSYKNDTLTLSTSEFPDITRDTMTWQINSTVLADDMCYQVSISRLGKSMVNKGKCQ